MKKRIDSVEISERRKRGGQPGNSNAIKTGRHTRLVKTRLREIRVVLRTMNATVVRIQEAYELKRRRGPRLAP